MDYITARKAAKTMVVANHPERPKIVYNIPPPAETRGGVRKYDHFYPFEDMLPGGSFWVPADTLCTRGAITKFAKKSGWKFITRAQSEDGVPNTKVGKGRRGMRVWRVE